MFDFQETIDTADKYSKDGNVALATFHYWLIGYAYQDEEFPYSYTASIGDRGRKGFLKLMKKYKHEILNSQEYLTFKSNCGIFPKYKQYFENFERVVQSFFSRSNRS